MGDSSFEVKKKWQVQRATEQIHSIFEKYAVE
jgi:hypothetical protein